MVKTLEINLGKLKRIVTGKNYAVYRRRSFVGGRVMDRIFLRSVESPHDAMELRADSLDDVIKTLKGARAAVKEE